MGYILNRLMCSDIDICYQNGAAIASVGKAEDLGEQVPCSSAVAIENLPGLWIKAPTGPTTITPIGMNQAINTKLTAKFISVDFEGNIVWSTDLDVEYNQKFSVWNVNLGPLSIYFSKHSMQEAGTNMVVIDDEP